MGFQAIKLASKWHDLTGCPKSRLPGNPIGMESRTINEVASLEVTRLRLNHDTRRLLLDSFDSSIGLDCRSSLPEAFCQLKTDLSKIADP